MLNSYKVRVNYFYSCNFNEWLQELSLLILGQ